jgi:hypothetical protein
MMLMNPNLTTAPVFHLYPTTAALSPSYDQIEIVFSSLTMSMFSFHPGITISQIERPTSIDFAAPSVIASGQPYKPDDGAYKYSLAI